MRSFVKIKSSRNAEITLSFSDIYLNAKVSQLLLKCYFLLFEPKILLHDIMINKSNDLPSKHMKIRPVRLTIADLRQEM